MNGNGTQVSTRCSIIGRSPAMRRALEVVERFAPTDIPILLVGETGTGKDLLAQQIHRLSGREGEFVDVNCGALPRDLVEGELFGHRRGAFTGAVTERPGLIAEAHHGTLFLDEILSLPLEGQAKLLRVLETGEVRRLGDTRKQLVDLRVVSAAQENLLQYVQQGRLRHDLYQRLAGVVVNLPPLRDRGDDVLELVRHFMAAVGRRLHEAAVPVVLHHRWPGNVRELRAVVHRATHMDPDEVVGPVALAEAIELGVPTGGCTSAVSPISPVGEKLLEVCRRAECDAGRAAALLGVSRATLYRRLKCHGMSLKLIARDVRIIETN